MKSYYVSKYSTVKSDTNFTAPYDAVRIGVASAEHHEMVTESINNSNVKSSTRIYTSLESAWNDCKQSCNLRTLVLNDNMDDEDRSFISDDINSHSDVFKFKQNGDSTSLYIKKEAYIDFMCRQFMCELNGLTVDFSNMQGYDLYIAYENLLKKREESESEQCARKAVFLDQARYQKEHSITFSREFFNSISDLSLDANKINDLHSDLCNKIDKVYGFDRQVAAQAASKDANKDVSSEDVMQKHNDDIDFISEKDVSDDFDMDFS